MSSQYLLVMMVNAHGLIPGPLVDRGLIIFISASTSCYELAIQACVDHNDYTDRYGPIMLIILLMLKSSSLCHESAIRAVKMKISIWPGRLMIIQI